MPDERCRWLINERRTNRLTIPSCPNCGSDGAQIVTRLITVLYARCVECGATWGIQRPGAEIARA